ncbi:hypothetical protein [Pseudarthrobacter polychromogenes]|uniref:Uncharacterized protein n=1 Tax=Pseudarthrobacter polychromogenes TaxID=1676 RepID=A0ABQ1Y3C3_9MICC|nr:hypothetical protein [Pseudarthrobacter polychromogenes]GGH10804.1 hypothetical protein GCM10011577_39740 [Pseudarthrobacter polychromogenes]
MDRVAEAQHLLLPFNRPEYFSVPEALLSSLAWRAYEIASEADVRKPVGLMYKADAKETQYLSLRPTKPGGAAAESLGYELKRRALNTAASDLLLGEAVASSVMGIRIEKTGNQPASPMTPALALMQDPRGVLVKKGPPDFGAIIESLFTVGHGPDGPAASATQLWLRAADQRLTLDPLLDVIDASMMSTVFDGRCSRRASSPISEESVDWCGFYPETPYEWFAKSWVALTSKEWVEVLPARVWVDWATTVLRLAMGLGFLWEYAWYEALGTAIIQNSVPDTFEELRATVRAPLPWQSSRSSVSVRDVGSTIKWRISRGERIRKSLKERLNELGGHQDAMDFLRDAAASEDFRRSLAAEVAEKKEAGKLVWETVKYGLQVRESSGPYTDYYGILKTRGRRYLVIDPGTEWIAVVASLTCGKPRSQCNVGEVLRDLTILGMRPELGDLVSLLERAGMARGSADADHAVIVESAF